MKIINNNLLLGRRVGKSIAISNPTILEIAQVCKFLGLDVWIEPHKGFPKDPFCRGRVRALLKDNDGQLKHDTLLTKGSLLRKIWELIPKLQTRAENPEGISHEDEEEKVAKETVDDSSEPTKAESTPSATSTQASAEGQKGDKKKKNKNKKKNIYINNK